MIPSLNSRMVSPRPLAHSHAECMLKYGTGRICGTPDYGSDRFRDVDFAPLKTGLSGYRCSKHASMSRSSLKGLLTLPWNQDEGLGYISVLSGMELKGPIVKFLSVEKQKF